MVGSTLDFSLRDPDRARFSSKTHRMEGPILSGHPESLFERHFLVWIGECGECRQTSDEGEAAGGDVEATGPLAQ